MRILFLCTENIMESVVAECVFRKRAEELLGDKSWIFEVESCGLEAVDRAEPHPECLKVLRDIGISERSLEAALVNKQHVEEADIVLTMTRKQRSRLAKMFPDRAHKYFSIMEANGAIESILEGRGIGPREPDWVRMIMHSQPGAIEKYFKEAASTLRHINRESSRPLSGVPLTMRELLVDFSSCFHRISGIESPLEGNKEDVEQCARQIDDEVTEFLYGIVALAVSEDLAVK